MVFLKRDVMVKTVENFFGKKEKTKIIAKLQKKGQGAPQREHAVSEEDQKRMMAYYYRKQEMKKLDKDAEDAYLDLEWADARALKRNFHHLKDIKLGPRG